MFINQARRPVKYEICERAFADGLGSPQGENKKEEGERERRRRNGRREGESEKERIAGRGILMLMIL